MKNSIAWFILGREKEISAAEIAAVLKLADNAGEFLAADILVIKNPPDANLIKRLGGTVKIAEEIGRGLTKIELKEKIIGELKNLSGKIHFGLSFHTVIPTERSEWRNPLSPKSLALSIKKQLKNEGRSVRYVPSDKNNQLSSAVVFHNQLTSKGREFSITKNENGFALAKTIAVQPFEEFGARDFGRPGRDDRSGMLPPKLAMIMINLARSPLSATLLDPFCGSGTILTEAMLLGYKNLIGSDISEKAIVDTRKNVEWTIQNQKSNIKNQNYNSKFKIFQCDVRNLSTQINQETVDTIVAEPYLGKPLTGRENEKELTTQANELKQLYLNAFQTFAKILKKNGVAIFIIPRFFSRGQWIAINCAPKIEKMGFKIIPLQQKQPYLLYGRPGQRVMREIWRFEKV